MGVRYMRSTPPRWRRWAVLGIVFAVALLQVIVAFAVLIVTVMFLFGDRSSLLAGIPWPWNGVVIYGSAILLFWGFTRLLGVRWTDKE